MADAAPGAGASSFFRGLCTFPYYFARYAWHGGFSRDHRPIFVAGCGHSGTTLLRAMLGRNRDVHGIVHESELFLFHSEGFARKLALVVGRNPYRRFVEWQTAASDAGRPRWVEKTPRHVQALGWILRLAPNARVVMITRDPRDVVASMVDRGLTFEHSLARWIEDNEAIVRWEPSSHCISVHYEDLVVCPTETLTMICDFVGLDFDPAMLEPSDSESVALPGWECGAPETSVRHLTRRLEQIRSPLFDGRGRWTNELRPDQVATILAATKDLREKLGYTDGD